MSNPFDEVDFFTSHLSADADVIEYPCARPSEYALNWVADPPNINPDITYTPQILHESVLGLSRIYGSGPVWTADWVPRPLNQTDVQVSDRSFLRTEQEPSPCAPHFWQPALRLSGREEETLARVGETHIPHPAHTIKPTESHSFGKLPSLSPKKHVDPSLPQLQSIVPRLHHTPHSLDPDSTRQADDSEWQWMDGVGPCSTVVEGTGSAFILNLNIAHAEQVRDERNHQAKGISPSCGLSLPCNESLPKHQRARRASREAVTATGEYVSLGVRDKDVQAVLTTGNPEGYNQDWSPWDMIAFNGHLIDEKVVTCRWADHGRSCNDPVKGKDLKAHLHFRHGVISDSQPYTCLWHGCTSWPMRKSSLGRHVEEQHIPVKWACPTCERNFTRKGNLMDHFERCPGRV